MSGKHTKRRQKNGRVSRLDQARATEQRRKLDPNAWRKALLADEQGTIVREAPRTVGLCYPNPYRTAMSSLGYQVIYRLFNSHPGLAAHRVVLPDEVALYRTRGWQPKAIESGRTLGSFDVLAFSVAYDLDILGVFELLSLASIPIKRIDRGPKHPPVIVGGPVTASNIMPFGPFIDLAVIGDGEHAAAALCEVIATAEDREDLINKAATIRGVWVPEIHGTAVPAVQKVTAGLPAVGQIITPHTELSNMFLIEASRGCPRYCKFCLVRAPESPMRQSEVTRVLDQIPAHAPRVGFVGAAVSEWNGIREALRQTIARGQGVGVSSLRADRLDEEFVDLLAKGGYRTMTVASDAASQRLRNRMAKGLKTRHLVNAAQLARNAGMTKLKLYVIIGLPDETDDDIEELISFSKELASILPTALGLSPLVPKLHTPLGDAPFAGIKEIGARLKHLRKALGGVVELRSVSAKWAWIEYRLSQGGESAGLAALRAWQQGGGFKAFEKEMCEVEEREALRWAKTHELWMPAGMR